MSEREAPAGEAAVQARGPAEAGARRALPPTAAKIQDASRRILVRRGYQALTMQAIEKESGCNRSLVHYYFGSKAGLIEALVGTLFEDPAFGYSDEVMEAPAGRERALALLLWLQRITADRRSGRLLYELVPHILRSPQLSAHVAGLYDAYRRFDGDCLGSGAQHLEAQTLQHLGALSVAVVEGLGIQSAVDSKGFDRDGAFDLWRDMVIAYLTAQQNAASDRAGGEGASCRGK